MEDSKRWTVTYTKHVKQKRKVYQDGVLELQLSRRKVILYDEGDILLDSRFLKKDDVIQSGETLAFDSFLVDIGDPRGGHTPASTFNCQEDSRVTDRPQPSRKHVFHSNATSVGRKPVFGKVKGRKVNLSPSEHLIRDFRDREVCKYGSSPTSLATLKSSTTEWQVLYTTKVTQKSKKFHDGFLQLLVQGSMGRQVMLYDTTRRMLESRFLKKHEIVCSGESLSFGGHLVEIGEQKGDQKIAVDPTHSGQDCKIIEKTNIVNHQDRLSTNEKFPVGKTPEKISQVKNAKFDNPISEAENASLHCGGPPNEPRRAVHDILTVLRKPIIVKEEPTENNSNHKDMKLVRVKEEPKENTSNCKDMKLVHVKEEPKENTSNHKDVKPIRVKDEPKENISYYKDIKPEIVEILPDNDECRVYENGAECLARSSSFCPSMERANQTKPSAQLHSLADAVLDCEEPIEIYSCEEITTEKEAAAVTGQSSIEFLQNNEKEMDEFPSFDLGFSQ